MRLDPRRLLITKKLHASPDFMAAPAEVLFTICNGCGAAGAKIDLVPDSIYGLDVSPACYVHDWDYHHGKTKADKARADQRLLLNLLIIIEEHSQNSITRSLRSMRAVKYYCAVRDFGDKAFEAKGA